MCTIHVAGRFLAVVSSSFAMAMAVAGTSTASPGHAIPMALRVPCNPVNDAQNATNAIGDDVDGIRSTLQAILVPGGKVQTINNGTVSADRDLRNLKNAAAIIGNKGLADAVNALGGAIQDMDRSVNGLYGVNTNIVIPSPTTYGFVDTAGDKQQVVAVILNGFRGAGCA
jgi:hypothetical protein